jgi:hypothetical protein
MLRRLRAIVGTAITWAVAWASLGLAFGVAAIARMVVLRQWTWRGVVTALVGGTLSAAIWGGIAGAAFAVVVALVERRRTIETLSVPRVALWGALGGALLPLVGLGVALVSPGAIAFPAGLGVALGFSAVAGGLCAAGSVTLARRAVRAELGGVGSSGALPRR